jgi:hypothetical protein
VGRQRAGLVPLQPLVNDRLWHLPDRAQLLDAKGNVREGVARERDVPAGFTPDMLATFEREPELGEVVALHLLESHFTKGFIRVFDDKTLAFADFRGNREIITQGNLAENPKAYIIAIDYLRRNG